MTVYRVRLHLEPQPEGGYTVTSDDLPELLTEGDSVEEALANARDAFKAVQDMYARRGQELPDSIDIHASESDPIDTEQLLAVG